jgi:Uma2 family endonuclease
LPTIALPPVPLSLQLGAALRLGEVELFELCVANPELRIERNAEGNLTVMTPAGGASSLRNTFLTAALAGWVAQRREFLAFDSSAGFILPNGAMRSPDAAIVRRSRLDAITTEAREGFLHLCPDLVVELRSHSDGVPDLVAKMQEYSDNGASLGWLIDPYERRVHEYRRGQDAHILREPESLHGGREFPDLIVPLVGIWNPFS